MTHRLNWLKAALWAVAGLGAVAVAARMLTGLGTTTDLSNNVSWGVWNAIKFSIVPLGGVAFVLACVTHILHMERFHGLTRLAIVTGFFCYSTFAAILTFDIGVPWRIWHPIVYHGHHSVLFEVALCVMSYLTVLAIEFAPMLLEHRWLQHPFFQKILHVLERATFVVPLIILGIILSVLHQSSLGALFLIVPHRLDPLWYSGGIEWVFLITAIGTGFLFIAVEAFLLEFFYGVRAPMKALAPLAPWGVAMMILAFLVRVFYYLFPTIEASAIGTPTHYGLYVVEFVLMIGVPALLFAPSIRNNRAGLFLCALSATLGVILYRFNVALLAIDWGAAEYFPTWPEWTLVFGVIAGAILVFLFFIEYLDIYGGIHKRFLPENSRLDFAPGQLTSGGLLSGLPHEAPRRYSLIFVFFAALGVALMPGEALFGSEPQPMPVEPPRVVRAFQLDRPEGLGRPYRLALPGESAPPKAQEVHIYKIDGDRYRMDDPDYDRDINRRNRYTLFNHEFHEEQNGGDASCAKCHHMNMPLDQNSSCHECHRDMNAPTDIFDHELHVAKLGDNASCAKCHDQPGAAANTRKNATPCMDCHEAMLVEGSRVEPCEGGLRGFASGYKQAMHDLCIGCHEERAKELGREAGGPDTGLTRCDTCHYDPERAEALRHAKPYALD